MSTKINPHLNPNPGSLRDRKGRPHYLARLPFYKKYPRFTILGGAIFFAILPFSGQLYNIFFIKPEDIKDKDDWWPSERARGKRVIDMWREKFEQEKLEREEKEQLKLAKKAAAAAAASK